MTQQMQQPVSVLMPICNEAAVLPSVIQEWHSEVFRHLPMGSEWIFDDGASSDGTLAILEQAQREHPYIRILYSQKEGFAASARRLYREARCPLVFFTDSDGQYVAQEFWKVAPFIDDHDMVHGAKVNRKDPVFRKVASRGFNMIAECLFHTGFNDINSAFRLMRKSMVDSLLPRIRSMPTLFNAEMLLRSLHEGHTVKQVNVCHRPRLFGESRGLPAARFLTECCKAYRGLLDLRREMTRPIPKPVIDVV